MSDKIGVNIIDSVEKILRYLIPGAAFCLLFALSYPSHFDTVVSKISKRGLGFEAFLIIFTIGISIYVVHIQIVRILGLFVFKIGKTPVNVFSNKKCLCNYFEAHAKLDLLRKEKQASYPEQYYFYHWAIVHYSFIMSYMLIFFSSYNEKCSWVASNSQLLRIVGIGILILSIFSFLFMQMLEKNATEKIKNNDADTKQSN